MNNSYNDVEASSLIGMSRWNLLQLATSKGFEVTEGLTLFSPSNRIKYAEKFVAGSENKLSVEFSTPTRHECPSCSCGNRAEIVVRAAFGKFRAFNTDGSFCQL